VVHNRVPSSACQVDTVNVDPKAKAKQMSITKARDVLKVLAPRNLTHPILVGGSHVPPRLACDIFDAGLLF
jgi:hypothetical protein